MCDGNENQPLWEILVAPTVEEYYESLKVGEPRKAGKTRLVVQSAVLAAVALWSLLPVFFGGTADYMLIGVAVAVCAAMWLVPPLKRKADAKNAVAAGATVRCYVWEEGLSFGFDGEVFPYHSLRGYLSPDQLTVAVDDALIPLPFRRMSEDCRAFLLERLMEKNV